MDRRALSRRLQVVSGFDSPVAEREQYPTPADVAASLLHVAAMNGDLAGATVLDLGTGTGMLALGAALCGADRVVGVDVDSHGLATARRNERAVAASTDVEWLLGDAARAPLCATDAVVVMNPPFGAQNANVHADRGFLETTARVARVSYSIHNAGSREFVESFADDRGATLTHAFAVELSIPRQFAFHTSDEATVDAEAYRVEWTAGDETAVVR